MTEAEKLKRRIYAKEYRKRESNRRYMVEYQTRWRRKNRQKVYARRAVWRAIKAGKLLKPDKCNNCKVKCVPEGHHADYSKWLEVTWLCLKCHLSTHKESGQGWRNDVR